MPRRQPDGLAPVVAGEVGDLEPVEDRELDRLLGAGRQQAGGVVELLDLVDRSRGTRRRARRACARGRSRCRRRRTSPASARAPQMLAIEDFGRPSRRASSLGPTGSRGLLGQHVEDERRPGDGRGERIAVAAVAVVVAARGPPPFASGPSSHRSVTVPRPAALDQRPASRMDRVQHIDLRVRRSPILFNLPPVVQYAGRIGRGSRGGVACRGSDRSRLRSAWCSYWRPVRRKPHDQSVRPPPPRPRRRPPPAASASGRRRRSSRPDAGRLAGRQVRGRQRQHPDLQRPAGRGAAPAARAGLGAPHRRPRQRHRGRRSRRSTTRRCSTRRPAPTPSTPTCSTRSGWATSPAPATSRT